MTKQKEKLIEFEQAMRLGPLAAASKLDTPYTTYKAWKSGRNKMPGCAYTAINLWLSIDYGPDIIEGELDAVHEDY